MPSFTNQIAASDLLNSAQAGAECPPEGWHEERAALRTNRNDILNFGSSLVVISLSLAVILGWLFRNPISGVSLLRTPSKKVHYFTLGILAVLGSFAGMIFGLDLDLGRGMFSPCADTIAIPIMGLIASLPIVLGLCVVGGVFCAVNFGNLPAGLWIWDHSKPTKSWLITLIFAGIAAFILFLAGSAMLTADFMIIGPLLLEFYLTLATRAAILVPK